MPFKSSAQLRKFGAMVKRGEISKAKFKQWRDETPNIAGLPKRVKKKTSREKYKDLIKGR